MVPAHQRQHEIVSLLSPTGRVGVGMLASRFHVTSETIRRDFHVLESRGLVQRVHGGAITPDSSRSILPLPPKPLAVHGHPPDSTALALAEAAAALIKPNTTSIFLDAGLIGTALASVLGTCFQEANWTVVTNSPGAGIILARAGMNRISVVGGHLSTSSQSIIGDRAVDMLSVLRADIAFVSADGVTPNHSLTSVDAGANSTKRVMITNSKFSVLLCAAQSFERQSGTSFANLSEFDALVTDADFHDPALSFLSNHDLQVVTP